MNCLKGDDQNSIFRQITTMIWDTAIFRVIMEGRKAKIQQNAEKPEFNSALHNFIDRNYFQAQSATIRRLVDTSFDLTGERGVYSLGALIEDIRKYRSELNRKIFFDLRIMPYDYAKIQEKEIEFLRKHRNGKWNQIPQDLYWEPIAETHRIFDRLSGVKPDQRSPSDLIDAQVLDRLIERLDECEHITSYVDKFVAHSATPESRINLSETGIRLSQIWDAQQILFEVANFLRYVLFFETQIPLMIENASFFQFWDKGLFEEDEEFLVRDTLKDYRTETEKWSTSSIENTWKWIEEGAGARPARTESVGTGTDRTGRGSRDG